MAMRNSAGPVLDPETWFGLHPPKTWAPGKGDSWDS
jgi:hypothetical protein